MTCYGLNRWRDITSFLVPLLGTSLIKCYHDNLCVWQRALFSMNFVKVQNECMLVIEGT